MALCSEVDDASVRKVRRVARVGELFEVDKVAAELRPPEQISDEVRPDEPGTAGHQETAKGAVSFHFEPSFVGLEYSADSIVRM